VATGNVGATEETMDPRVRWVGVTEDVVGVALSTYQLGKGLSDAAKNAKLLKTLPKGWESYRSAVNSRGVLQYRDVLTGQLLSLEHDILRAEIIMSQRAGQLSSALSSARWNLLLDAVGLGMDLDDLRNNVPQLWNTNPGFRSITVK